VDEPLDAWTWTRPNQFVRAAILTELRREVADGHSLGAELGCGRGPGVLARCEECDLVCVALVGGAFAHVRLTWSGRAEPLPSPATVFTGTAAANERAMARHAEAHAATARRGTNTRVALKKVGRLGG